MLWFFVCLNKVFGGRRPRRVECRGVILKRPRIGRKGGHIRFVEDPVQDGDIAETNEGNGASS